MQTQRNPTGIQTSFQDNSQPPPLEMQFREAAPSLGDSPLREHKRLKSTASPPPHTLPPAQELAATLLPSHSAGACAWSKLNFL